VTPASSGDAVLAHDLGTTGDKAALYDAVDAGMIAQPLHGSSGLRPGLSMHG
jgi:sugar (pentulose or hexulose) kinase